MVRGEIEPGELQRLLKADSPPCIVDVRSAAEYRSAHLPGAQHLPFWLLPFRWRRLAAASGRAIVVYCEHGPRAAIARRMLLKRGFSEVYNLRGHMQRWRREKRPLTTGASP